MWSIQADCIDLLRATAFHSHLHNLSGSLGSQALYYNIYVAQMLIDPEKVQRRPKWNEGDMSQWTSREDELQHVHDPNTFLLQSIS